MKYLTILENGMVWPNIKASESIVAINDGVIRVGKYNKNRYLDNQFYLDAPFNESELIDEVVEHIKMTNVNLLIIKDLDLHFVCPKEISSKFVWTQKEKMIEKAI
jgi:hypothetical protein